jgi:hypothetical protein
MFRAGGSRDRPAAGAEELNQSKQCSNIASKPGTKPVAAVYRGYGFLNCNVINLMDLLRNTHIFGGKHRKSAI